MGIGRPRLGVEVVAVVPDRDQAEVVDRGERGRPGPDDDPTGAPTHQQELAVARAGSGVGLQRDVLVGTEDLEQCGVDPGHVPVVGHADDGAPATGQGGCRQLREQPRPVLPRRGGPDGTGAPTRAQVPEVCRGSGIGGPFPIRHVEGPDRGGGRRGLLLDRGVARRHREASYVGAHACVTLGDPAAELGDGWGQHGLGAHRATQRRQPPVVLAGAHPLHHEAVDVLTGEPHLHADAGEGLLGHRRRHGVVEGPVEVGERQVDHHPGDRIDLGELDRRRLLRATSAGGSPGLPRRRAREPR